MVPHLPPPEPPPDDEALAEALEEYHRRLAAGLPVRPEDFEARLGAAYADFRAVLEAEEAIDVARGPLTLPLLTRPFGKYTLLRKVGAGGVGEVYEAVERPLGRVVALKLLKEDQDALPEARERFLNEANLTAAVRHDHIVAIHDSGEVEGRLYFTMDLVVGRSLDRLMATHEVPEQRVLAREIAHVVDALAALHAAKIVHRDIKPHNIMVRADGRMILADFGLARIEGGMRFTKTGHVSATGHYASPEQLRAERSGVDHRSDVYNVGATLFAALVGHPPFPTESWNELYRQKLHGRAPRPRTLVPSIDPDLEAIVVKCLEPDPADRYATAEALAEQLRRFAAGQAVTQGGPVALPRRVARWARRRWLPLGAAAAALLAFGWWWTHRPARILFDDQGFEVAGEILLDGALAGRTPTELAVGPGAHHVVVERPDFQRVERRFHLEAGEVVPFPTFPLLEANDAGREAYARFVRARFAIPPIAGDVPRSGDEGMAPLTILAPEGPVRLEDLAQGWAVDLDPEAAAFPSASATAAPSAVGALVLRRGATELWRQEFLAPPLGMLDHMVCGRFPDALLGTLRPGDALVFAWDPPPDQGLDPVSAEVRLLDVDPAGEALARLTAYVGPAASGFAHQMRAELLLKHGLHTAAWFAAVAAAQAEPTAHGPIQLLTSLLDLRGLQCQVLLDWANALSFGRKLPTLCVPTR